MEACEHCGADHAPEHLYCPATGKLMAARLLPRHSMLEDKYLIGEPVGIGGMGAVFEAKHTLLDKRVAIKVMLGQDEEGTKRLIREARAASSTGHPNITSVTDMGRTPQGSLFVVMEFLDGRTVKELLSDGPLPAELALRLVEQVLAGLEAVHRKGIVHRDLKPDNLMVVLDDEGMEVVKILDFGISKLLQDEGSQQGLTQTGLVMGTPLYMAPEQARGDNAAIGPATDIYAVGAILYAMVTGQPPHIAETLAALISAKLEQRIERPSKRVPGLPAGLDALLMRALAKEGRDRFANAREMREEVIALLGEDPALLPHLSNPAIPIAPRRTYEEDLTNGLDALDSATLDDELVPLDASGGALRAAPKAPPKAPARKAADELPPPAQTMGPTEQEPALEKAPEAQRHDPFAPPEDEFGDGAGLQLATEPLHQRVAAVERSKETMAPPPEMPALAYGGQARKRSRVPTLLLLLVLVLGGGGAYTYFAVLKKGESTVPQVGDEVTIQIITTPANAEVVVDGYALPSSTLKLRASDRLYKVEVKAAGYQTQHETFRPQTDLVLRVDLKKKVRPRRSPEKKSPKAATKPRREGRKKKGKSR